MNEVMKNIVSRRSIRKYTEQQVTDEDINLLLEAGKYAPSGSNAQSRHFIVIQNQAVIGELNQKIREAFLAFKVTENTFKPIVYGKAAAAKDDYLFNYNAPTLVILADEAASGNAYVDCACAIENMFLAANSIGLSTCWLNQLRWLNEVSSLIEYMNDLGMPVGYKVFGAFALGYRDGEIPPPIQHKENTVTIIK